MKFDSNEAEEYFHEQTKDYGDIQIQSGNNMIWTIDKIDNLVFDLKKINDFEKHLKNYHVGIKNRPYCNRNG